MVEQGSLYFLISSEYYRVLFSGAAKSSNFSVNSEIKHTVGKYILPSHNKGEQTCLKSVLLSIPWKRYGK
jgi:hypothetical protein